jgi:hypothetical protein
MKWIQARWPTDSGWTSKRRSTNVKHNNKNICTSIYCRLDVLSNLDSLGQELLYQREIGKEEEDDEVGHYFMQLVKCD